MARRVCFQEKSLAWKVLTWNLLNERNLRFYAATEQLAANTGSVCASRGILPCPNVSATMARPWPWTLESCLEGCLGSFRVALCFVDKARAVALGKPVLETESLLLRVQCCLDFIAMCCSVVRQDVGG